MTKALKCPRCKQQTAWLSPGWAKDRRYFTSKHCSCGYEGLRKYFSLEMSNRLREASKERRLNDTTRD